MNRTTRQIARQSPGRMALLATVALIGGCASMGSTIGVGAGYGYGPGYASPWGAYDPFHMNPIYLGPPMTVRSMPVPPPDRPTTLPGKLPGHSMPPGRRR